MRAFAPRPSELLVKSILVLPQQPNNYIKEEAVQPLDRTELSRLRRCRDQRINRQ